MKFIIIIIIMGFRHAHLCTNDYPYSYGFSSCTYLYKWLSIFFLIGFFSSCSLLYEWISISFCNNIRHAHFCTNDYRYSYGFSSCTSLYEWMSIFLLVYVMNISVRMTILFPISFQWVYVKPEYLEHHGVSLLMVSS